MSLNAKRYNKGKRKYFHASRYLKFRVGDIIYPQNSQYCAGLDKPKPALWLSNNSQPHFTLWWMEDEKQNIGNCRYNMYQVVPLGKVKRGEHNDLVTHHPVKIVKCLGEVSKNKGNASKVYWHPRPNHHMGIEREEKKDLTIIEEVKYRAAIRRKTFYPPPL